MILITSGAYLQNEFSNEVGILPPCFLPIGNKRLYEYQVELLRAIELYENQEIYLSIPNSYRLSDFDKINLERLNINIILAPDHLTLASSILYSWTASGKNHETLTILHGDTLFLHFNSSTRNTLSVHPNKGFHKRAKLEVDAKTFMSVRDDWTNDRDLVFSGFFRFNNPLYFMKLLVESESNFTEAVRRYYVNFEFDLNSSGEWLDFGHINNFYQARSRLTTERAFNSLNIDKNTVTKSSESHPLKIYAEGSWFAQLPQLLRLHTPALLDLRSNEDSSSYTIEYLYSLPLSDLIVFGNLSEGTWTSIFNNVQTILSKFSKYKPKLDESSKLLSLDLYLSKTLDRLSEYQHQSKTSISEQKFRLADCDNSYTLEYIAIDSSKYISDVCFKDLSIIHGDFCFSNILFDSRAELVKCIDPRGLTINNQISIYGDKRYDLAKLYHSIFGKYDFIIANHFDLKSQIFGDTEIIDFQIMMNDNLSNIESLFQQLILLQSDYTEKEILAITIHLFLSMLPLHFDNPLRQKAFIANTLRLYEIFRRL